MSDNDNKYRQQADDALRMAGRATNDLDRASWLQVAQGWLSLVTRPARTDEQTFDDNTRDRQTGPSSKPVELGHEPLIVAARR